MKSISEQLLSLKVQSPANSKPRCMCHNRYIEQCPEVTKHQPWDCKYCRAKQNSPGRSRCRICGESRGKK